MSHIRLYHALIVTGLAAFPAMAQTPPGSSPMGASAAPASMAPAGPDCGRLTGGGASSIGSQAMQDDCGRQPGQSSYSRAHEEELNMRERRLVALQTQSLSAHGPQSAALQRQVDQEQARIDALRSARNRHVEHVQDAEQIHRARLGSLTDAQRARLGHLRPELMQQPSVRSLHPTAAPSLPPVGMPGPANVHAPGGPGTTPRGG